MRPEPNLYVGNLLFFFNFFFNVRPTRVIRDLGVRCHMYVVSYIKPFKRWAGRKVKPCVKGGIFLFYIFLFLFFYGPKMTLCYVSRADRDYLARHASLNGRGVFYLFYFFIKRGGGQRTRFDLYRQNTHSVRENIPSVYECTFFFIFFSRTSRVFHPNIVITNLLGGQPVMTVKPLFF